MNKKEYPGGEKKARQDGEVWSQYWEGKGLKKYDRKHFGGIITNEPVQNRRSFMGSPGLNPSIYTGPERFLKSVYEGASGNYEILAEIYEKEGKKQDAIRCQKMAEDLKKREGRERNWRDDKDSMEEGHRRELLGLRRMWKRKGLSGIFDQATATASIVGIVGGIFFLSTNITGNAIADMTTKTTSFLGAGLLIVGLVAGFFWVKSRKSN
jgi:hypothetical protein